MTQQLRAYLDAQAQIVDDDLRQAIEVSGGDAVSALRAALIANAILMDENEKLKKRVSKGFARGVK